MKITPALVLLAIAAVSPEIRYFRNERPVQNTPQRPAQTCIVLDPELFAHTSAQLSDLRLYHDGKETPYVIRLSAPVETTATVTIGPDNRNPDVEPLATDDEN